MQIKTTTNEEFDSESSTTNSDINFAAALRAQYAIKTPKPSRRRKKKALEDEIEEPLIDKTSMIPLHSKKTERLQRRQHKKSQKAAHSGTASLTELPTEILVEITAWLSVADVFRLSRTSHALMDFIQNNGTTIAKSIIRTRYWILHRCFPVPIAFENVPEEYHEGLLSAKRQDLLNIHRKSYHQHIEMVNPLAVCTCLTCVFAWNNLCLLVDVHHWQPSLDKREPIPIVPRGKSPEWNQALLKANADIVRSAMEQPLYYVAILEKHLATITGTILRSSRWKRKGDKSAKPRLYHMTDWDIDSGTDAFLARKGPPSYDFPYHRDVYYSIEAYLPNRRFVDQKWHYYPMAPAQHERDLEWVKSTMQSSIPNEQRRVQALANLKDHNIRWSQYLEQAQQV